MRTRRAILALIVAALLPVASPPQALARIGGWASGNAQYILITAICRDGARFKAYIMPNNPGSSTDLGARLYQNAAVALPFDTASITHLPEDNYGPRLLATRDYPLATHATPMPPSTPPQPHSNITVYEDDGVIRWPRELTPGVDRVVITHLGAGYVGDVVEDCRVGEHVAPQGGTLTIGDTALWNSVADVPADALRYTVTELPAHGVLRLDGAPLGVGGVFTQADVAAGRLRYQNDGQGSPADGFGYSVRAVTRVSVSGVGGQGNGASSDPALSANGAVVAYQSLATNLVSGDTNGVSDVFTYRRASAATKRVSANGAVQANGASGAATISSRGDAIAFQSTASNLVSGGGACDGTANDTNGVSDIFLGPTDGGPSRRVSIGVTSFNSCYQGNGAATQPAISADGYDVAYSSAATNLLQFNSGSGGTADTNGFNDVYGRMVNNTSLVSRATGAGGAATTGGPSSSPAYGGSGYDWHIAFASSANNLSALDNDSVTNIYVRDGGETAFISRSTGGTAADGASGAPTISNDGRLVAFSSSATNLVSGDTNGLTDIFLRDRDTDADGVFDEPGAVSTVRLSVGGRGAQADGASAAPQLGRYGQVLAFSSDATNLVSGDTNGARDIFVRDLTGNVTTRVSLAYDGAEPNGACRNPSISADGSVVAFESDASNLVPGDTNGATDVFIVYTGYRSYLTLRIGPGKIRLPGVLR